MKIKKQSIIKIFFLFAFLGISLKMHTVSASADVFQVVPSSQSSYSKIGNAYFRQWDNALYYKGSSNGAVRKKTVSQKNVSAVTDGTTVYYKGRYQSSLYKWTPKTNQTSSFGSTVSGSYMVPLLGGDTVNLYYHRFSSYAKCDVYKFSLKTKKSTLLSKNAVYLGCYKNNVILQEDYGNGASASPLYSLDRNTGKLIKQISSKASTPAVIGGKVYFAYQKNYSSISYSGTYYARSYDLNTKKYKKLSPTFKNVSTIMNVNHKYFSYRTGDRLSGRNYKYTYSTKKNTVIS